MTDRKRKVMHTTRAVCARFGGVTPMTIYRWERDERMGFPQPTYINGRKYYDDDELDEFDRQRKGAAA